MSSPLAHAAKHSVALLRQTIDILPAAAYTCDGEGLLTYFNRHAEQVWGMAPWLNDVRDRFCGSFRLLDAAGNLIERDDCWMAQAIKNRREYLAQETVIERPDSTRVTVFSYATPMLTDDGRVGAAMNILVNITDRKYVEDLLDNARRTRDCYRAALADALREQLAPMRSVVRRLSSNMAARLPMAKQLLELEERLVQMRSLINEMVDSPTSMPEPKSSTLTFRNGGTRPRKRSKKEFGEEEENPHSSPVP